MRHLLLIGAYRDNEVDSAHQLALLLVAFALPAIGHSWAEVAAWAWEHA